MDAHEISKVSWALKDPLMEKKKREIWIPTQLHRHGILHVLYTFPAGTVMGGDGYPSMPVL